MKTRMILGAIMLLTATGGAFCGGRTEALTVATDPTWEPMEFTAADGRLDGYDMDLMRAVAKAGGFDLTLTAVGWDSIFSGLAEKRYDAVISAVTITDNREKTMDFSEPYLQVDQYLVVSTETENVTGFADLNGKSIGALRGSASLVTLENNRNKYNLTVVPYDDYSGYVVDLHLGKLAAFVAEAVIVSNMNRNTEFSGSFKIAGPPVATEYYGIAVRKGDSKTRSLINGGLRKVLASGESKAIEQRWLK